MQQPLNDNRLYSCFVSPNICRELESEGFVVDTPYRWHVYSHWLKLITQAFDIDDYYLEGLRLNDSCYPPEDILPAYTLKDCEMALPAYGLSVNAYGHYCLGVDKYFNELGYIVEPRLPDAFARCVVKAIQKKLLDINTINEKISR